MMQLSQNRKKGKIGEVHAAAFLKRNGYTLLDRNYAYRGGELDIVAQSSSGTLLFVEVKTVWNTKKGAPESRVNAQKKFRLWRTACHYLYTKKYPENTPCRFDVLAIHCNQSNISIKHFQNAFESVYTIPTC